MVDIDGKKRREGCRGKLSKLIQELRKDWPPYHSLFFVLVSADFSYFKFHAFTSLPKIFINVRK